MANSYLAGVFNVDTPNTTITALETLKGSDIAKTDNIYFYGGVADVMLILDKSFAVNQIIRGRTSAGAASAGSRGGIMVVNNGIMVQFQGNATNTSSGFNSNPTTPDESSLGEAIRHDGDYTTVFTRYGDTYLSTSRFTLEVRYGWLNVRKLVVRNTHTAVIVNLGTDATRTNGDHLFDQCDVMLASQSMILSHTVPLTVKIMVTRTIIRMQGVGGGSVSVVALSNATSVLGVGGMIDASDSYIVNGSTLNFFYPIATYATGNTYLGNCRMAYADIRQGVSISFYLDKTVVPVTAGTLITVTLSQDVAILMTGLTLKGVACTDRTVIDASHLTFAIPTLTDGIGDVVGSFTGYDDYPIYNGITAQAGASAPGAPVIGERYTLSTKVAINIQPPTGYEYIDIYRDAVLLEADIDDPTLYEDTTVSASTAYVYTAKGRNATGTGVASNELTLTTSASDVPIEERIIKGMKELTEGMLISNGYFFDWQTANTQDEAKIETYPAVVKIEGTTEENTDEDNSIDSLSYSNMMNVNIHCVGKLTTESTNPKDAIRLVINKMLVDLKKLFGTYYYINDEAETEMIFYKGYEYRDNPARDMFDPIQLITNWKIRYRQKRTNPLVNIL